MKLKFINLYLASQYINSISVNLNYFMLKSYYRYKNESNHNRIEWTNLLWQPNLTVDEIVQIVVDEKIDILCMSLFVWNSDLTYMVAEKVKQKMPAIKIIVGGPDVFALNNPQYFEDYPYVDYAVYGDGEEAFCSILDSILENSPLDNAVNVVTKEKTFPHKIFFDPLYNKQSAFMSERHILKNHIIDLILTLDDNFHIQVRWERARGCPYTCSFCDWSSGLHHKVKRRESNWKQELDFLLDLPVTVVPTDANWGIYKEDIKITEYAVTKGKFFVSNFSKLHKDRVYKIFDIIASKSPKSTLKISLQDIHEDVLKNIDRPEVPWNEQREYIKQFQDKHKDIKLIAEIITGLPGQTIEKQIAQLHEFADTGIKWMICFFWELIPNSPANNPKYQRKFDMQFEELVLLNSRSFSTVEEIDDSINQGRPGWSKAKIVVKCGTQELPDILTCYALTELYKKLMQRGENIDLINHSVAEKIRQHMESAAQFILESKVFGIYSKSDKCYYSPEKYFSNLTLEAFIHRYG